MRFQVPFEPEPGVTIEPENPVVRAVDSTLYMRPDVHSLLLGGFEPRGSARSADPAADFGLEVSRHNIAAVWVAFFSDVVVDRSTHRNFLPSLTGKRLGSLCKARRRCARRCSRRLSATCRRGGLASRRMAGEHGRFTSVLPGLRVHIDGAVLQVLDWRGEQRA